MKNKLIKLLRKIIQKYYIFFGCEFEINLPPEFIITDHARQRLTERIGVSEKKMKQLTMKAWYCKERVKEEVKKRSEYYHKGKNKNIVFRSCMGYTFIFKRAFTFGVPHQQKILITVYN